MCVNACGVTGEGDGVRGVMLQSLRAVAGDEGADKSSPGCKKSKLNLVLFLFS